MASKFGALAKQHQVTPVAESTPETAPQPETIRSEARPGRAKGKRSDPGYRQVSAYVPADLYNNVQTELFNHHNRQEFSELVTELLNEWLATQKGK